MGSPADQELLQPAKIDAVQDAETPVDETEQNEKEDNDLEGNLIMDMDSRGSEESTRSNETENSRINRTNGVSNQTSDQNDSDQIEQINHQTDDQTMRQNSPDDDQKADQDDPNVDQNCVRNSGQGSSNFRFSLSDELVLEDEPRNGQPDEQQLNIDKQKVLNHPLFKLLGKWLFALFEDLVCLRKSGICIRCAMIGAFEVKKSFENAVVFF